MTGRRTLWRRSALLVGAVSTLILGTMANPGSGGATAPFGSFSVSARADLFHVQAFEDRAPIIPAGQPAAELSPATAHAAIDSLGTSVAFASAPYPGETVVGLPGLLGGISGGELPPLPGYPVYVSSSHPTEADDSVDQAAYKLSSSSSSTASSGSATFGGGDSGAMTGQARSTVQVDGDLVSAEAAARLSGLVLPDTLELGDIESRAAITVTPDAEPQVETAFSVGLVTVGGIDLRIGPDGLDLRPVENLMTELGIGLDFIPAESGTTEDGSVFARSAGLRVQTTQEGPDAQSTRVVLELGRTFASADARPAQQIAQGPVADGAAPPIPTEPAPEAAPAPTPRSEVPDARPATPGVAEPEDAAPVAVSSGPFDPGPTLTLLYAALAIAAVLSAASGRLLGVLGVRLRFGHAASGP